MVQEELGLTGEQGRRSRRKGGGSTKNGPERVTKLGKPMDIAVSAMQKECRRGDERAACYWTLLVYETSPFYCWKRLLVIAAEDVGFGDPAAVALVGQLHSMWLAARQVGWGTSAHHVAMAVMALCRAKKSTEVEDLLSLTQLEVKAKVLRPILPEYLDGHTAEGKARGFDWKDWYRFRHVVCAIPISAYTRALWRLRPEWAPEELVDEPSPHEPGESR
jgi:replication-associated recombination protein RarA